MRPGAHGPLARPVLTPASRPGFTDLARALGYEIEPGGEHAFAGALLREVITCWLTAGIDA